jgi:hypothetical protein
VAQGVEYWSCMLEDLGSIPTTERKEGRKKEKERERK